MTDKPHPAHEVEILVWPDKSWAYADARPAAGDEVRRMRIVIPEDAEDDNMVIDAAIRAYFNRERS